MCAKSAVHDQYKYFYTDIYTIACLYTLHTLPQVGRKQEEAKNGSTEPLDRLLKYSDLEYKIVAWISAESEM